MALTNLILTELQNIENREIVNTSQDEFSIDKLEDELWVWVNNDYNDILEQAYPMVRFVVARHCIALLPCFDVENPEYTKLDSKWPKGVYESTQYDGLRNKGYTDLANEIKWRDFTKLEHTPKTIRQALLTCGAMDLQELEKYAQDNNLIPTI